MKLKNLLIHLIFLLFISQYVSAQFDCVKTVENKSKPLESLQNKYANTSSVTSSFTQRAYMSALDVVEESSGSLWIKKPGFLKWHYQDPEEQMYLIKDQTFWHYVPFDLQVNVSNFADLNLSQLPSSFLLGLGNLKRDFNILSVCKNAEDQVYFRMQPKENSSNDSAIKELQLLVSNADWELKGARIEDQAGNTTELMFKKVEFNRDLEDNIFSLEYPENVYVNDLRKAQDIDNG